MNLVKYTILQAYLIVLKIWISICLNMDMKQILFGFHSYQLIRNSIQKFHAAILAFTSF